MSATESVVTKRGKAVKEKLIEDANYFRAKELTQAFVEHLDAFHLLPEQHDRDIDKAILEEELRHIISPKKLPFTRGLPVFSPSSASKCELELYYKAIKAEKDEQVYYAFQRRWNRNGSAVHAATQRDLLYAEKYLPEPKFTVERMEDGSPAWEQNLKTVKPFLEYGFQLFGMMDGILHYTPDGSRIGFEFKTKSTTVSAIGDYKLKSPNESHVEQCVAYSLMFGVDEFLIVYESLAKDSWNKGEEAKPDIKAFYIKVTQAEKDALIQKFAKLSKNLTNKVKPNPDETKCIFCPYKSKCQEERKAS